MQLHPSSPTPLHPVYPNNLRSVDSQDQPTNHWLALHPTKTTMIRASNSIRFDYFSFSLRCFKRHTISLRFWSFSGTFTRHELPSKKNMAIPDNNCLILILDEPVVALWKVIRLWRRSREITHMPHTHIHRESWEWWTDTCVMPPDFLWRCSVPFRWVKERRKKGKRYNRYAYRISQEKSRVAHKIDSNLPKLNNRSKWAHYGMKCKRDHYCWRNSDLSEISL